MSLVGDSRLPHPGGSPPPDPAIYGLAAPSVLPPCCLRGTRQDLPFTSTEVVYGVTGTEVTELPEYGVSP